MWYPKTEDGRMFQEDIVSWVECGREGNVEVTVNLHNCCFSEALSAEN